MKKAGFTLIELSIVLVIISLIVGGIVGGKALIRSAKLGSVASDVQKIRSALNTFLLQYDALPGDLRDATAYWSVSTVANGNGNGVIESTDNSMNYNVYSELSQVFLQLSLAGIVEGTYSPAGRTLETYRGRMGYPSPFTEGVYIVSDRSVYNYGAPGNNYMAGNTQNVIKVGGVDSLNDVWAYDILGIGIMSVSDAVSIDKKVDDGKARSGAVSGVNGMHSASYTSQTGCLKFNSGNTSTVYKGDDASYNLGTDFLCNMSFEY